MSDQIKAPAKLHLERGYCPDVFSDVEGLFQHYNTQHSTQSKIRALIEEWHCNPDEISLDKTVEEVIRLAVDDAVNEFWKCAQ